MNEKKIWDFLLDKIGNSYGVAGLMGNLYVESKLNSDYLQSSYARKLNMTSSEYTEAVDNGSYNSFIDDKAGYGLAQWTFWSRKEALLNYAKSKNKSIGDLDMQLEYLWNEIQSYKTVMSVLKTAQSVREASDVVLERYEKAADQSNDAKIRRCEFGLIYYNKYVPGQKIVTITTDRVNIRNGNGKQYKRILLSFKGNKFPWVTTVGDWHAIVVKEQVGWVSGEFSEVR